MQDRRKTVGEPLTAIVQFQIQHPAVGIELAQPFQDAIELRHGPGRIRALRDAGTDLGQQTLARIQAQTGIVGGDGVQLVAIAALRQDGG